MNEMILLFAFFIVIGLGLYIKRLKTDNTVLRESIAAERKDAVKRSKAVTRGNIAQEFIPLFPDFPYNLSDCKFSGQPIDFMVFENMTSVRDGTDVKVNVVLADVKVNKAQRTKVQNAIKDAVEGGRVRWETWTVAEDKTIKIK